MTQPRCPIAIASLMALLFGSWLSQQSQAESGNRPPDECGNPALVSQGYTLGIGTVREVESGDTVTVDFPRGKYQTKKGRHKVRLVGIAAPPLAQELGQKSKARLEERLMGRSVQVLFSPFQEAGQPINAMLELEGGDAIDENRGQIEAGMAQSIRQGPYDVDWWVRCHYDHAQERAKAAGLGVWGK